jgi:hypothetical protein
MAIRHGQLGAGLERQQGGQQAADAKAGDRGHGPGDSDDEQQDGIKNHERPTILLASGAGGQSRIR